MTFHIFDAAVPRQRADWLALWQTWPAREIHAHPDYAALFARDCDRTLCATLTGSEGRVMFPFILRPLQVEPWAGAGDGAACDIVSPYGYGGPFAWGCPDTGRFWQSFDAWAVRTHVVSAFVRLSLFPEQLIAWPGKVEVNAPNAVRRLDRDAASIWMDYEHKVRKNVNKARRNGLRVVLDEDGARLGDFLAVYYDTLQRRSAASNYYFPASFFERILTQLRGQFAFFFTLHGKAVVSAELVLASATHLYSFLGGTRASAFELRPNDLLKHTIIEWGIEQGKEAFVLGGGYGGAVDGIFRYKLSFAPRGEVPFTVGKRIYDTATHEHLVRGRQESEAAAGRAWTPRAGFFPVYRA